MPPLPPPPTDALEHSASLVDRIRQVIAAAGGWISFAQFMDLALFAPGLGYYAAGARKFGGAGDFVTAPEMTPLFGRALARQVRQIMEASAYHVLEAGAGSGRLAADLLSELDRLGALPERYSILELSADLRQRQRDTLAAAVPQLVDRVEWLEGLPEGFAGAIVGNEVLDAMPVHLVHWAGDGIFERGVAWDGGFVWRERPAVGAVLSAAVDVAGDCGIDPDFVSEIALAAPAWVAEWGDRLERGALLLIDYGFPRAEFYHPQRSQGTLMCHYRHLAHGNPFVWPGLQDITAHVDFTGLIAAAHRRGLELYGFASQAAFLCDCGILDRLGELGSGSVDYLQAAGAVNKLLLPHEMGELFKVIAIGRGIDSPLLGFATGDRSERL